MTIGECHKCGEQVQEGTVWDISNELGFICETCIKTKLLSHGSYLEDAAWLKEHNFKTNKQLKGG